MSYPHPEFPDDGEMKDNDISQELYGKEGLMRVMNFNESKKNEFEYLGSERIFAKENLVKYSGKLSNIMQNVE